MKRKLLMALSDLAGSLGDAIMNIGARLLSLSLHFAWKAARRERDTSQAIGGATLRTSRALSRDAQDDERRGMEFFVLLVLAILVVVTIIGVIAWATL